jgi:hypothetical protein
VATTPIQEDGQREDPALGRRQTKTGGDLLGEEIKLVDAFAVASTDARRESDRDALARLVAGLSDEQRETVHSGRGQ